MKMITADAGRMSGYEHQLGLQNETDALSFYSPSCSSTSIGIQKGTIPLTGRKLVHKDSFAAYNTASVFPAV